MHIVFLASHISKSMSFHVYFQEIILVDATLGVDKTLYFSIFFIQKKICSNLGHH